MLTSSLHFIYTDIKSVFDRARAWIALIFYWFDSIYQWLTSDLIGWQRGEGGEVLINLFCVHGFEIHPCRLVFKNSLTEFGKHKTNIYLIFIKKLTKKFVRSQKFGERIGSQTLEVCLGRLVKQPNIEKLYVCSWRKSDGQCYTFSYWNHSRHGFFFEKLEVTLSAEFFHKQLSFLNGSNIKLDFS